MATPAPGQIGWIDLTTEYAESLRLFYEKVVGWTSQPVDMGGYSDYCMQPAGVKNPVAGICHAKGANATLPPQWLMYITVPDLEGSLRECSSCGGEVITPVRETDSGRFAVIRDPAGAVCALFKPVAS